MDRLYNWTQESFVTDVSINDTPMTIYMRNKMRADTANELNESTQSTYRSDLVYLFFKLLLFFILGGTFYYLMKDQNTTEIIQKIKENTKVVTDTVVDTVKSIKSIKDKTNDKIKDKTKDKDE